VGGKILVHVFSIPVCHHPYFMIIKIYHLNICVAIHIILKAGKEIIPQTNAGKNRGLCRSKTCQEITILIIKMYLKKE